MLYINTGKLIIINNSIKINQNILRFFMIKLLLTLIIEKYCSRIL